MVSDDVVADGACLPRSNLYSSYIVPMLGKGLTHSLPLLSPCYLLWPGPHERIHIIMSALTTRRLRDDPGNHMKSIDMSRPISF